MAETTRIGSPIPKELIDAYHDACATALPTAWELLVERYKDDRIICNCRQAWYARIGDPVSHWDGREWQFGENNNPRCCRYGCQNAQLACKKEIGRRVVEEFGLGHFREKG